MLPEEKPETKECPYCKNEIKYEDTIIKICANRTNAHRLQIAAYYKAAYGKDLISDLKTTMSTVILLDMLSDTLETF